MKNIIRKNNSVVILLFVILYFLISPSLIFAQKHTHIVQEGDTLWDICEQYYGDANLWPKLWEMNPFITNPHLLKKGDVITLFEEEPVKEEKKIEVTEEKPPVTEEEAEPTFTGIDISRLTEVNAIGYLYTDKIQTWGKVFATDNNKLMLTEGETAYVIFDEGRDIEIGDKFFVGNSSPELKHPITEKDLGYTFNVNGVITIEERLGQGRRGDEYYEKENVFKSNIDESYGPIAMEAVLMPYKPVSSCVLPVSANKKINANIVATKNQQELIPTNTIVYIDLGSNHDLKRGNVLNVIKPNIVPDPDPSERFFTWRSKLILPDIFVGRIMIIECGLETSSAIVLSAVEPFSPGVYVKELSWDKTPDFLLKMLDCSIQ